ncbi:MAG: c-type cytochrome [Pseudomonadales bacterium]|nr:c-type cytochrome [Pseudomonadales bacterium]
MKHPKHRDSVWNGRPQAVLLAFLTLSASGIVSAQELGDHQYTSEAIQAGLRVYSRECALCHGPQGDLVSGINLARGQFRTASSDDDLRSVITEGRAQGQMPAFALREEELSGVIAYIRAGFDPDGVAIRIGDPVRGRELFTGKGRCADCHRVNGEGPRTAPDLSAIGVMRTPAILQLNLLDPAAAVLPINRPVRIVTRSEETITGRRLNEDTYTVQLIDSEERLRSLQKSELVSYEVSEQPSKQPTDLSSDEVADVIGYLLTLRGAP